MIGWIGSDVSQWLNLIRETRLITKLSKLASRRSTGYNLDGILEWVVQLNWAVFCFKRSKPRRDTVSIIVQLASWVSRSVAYFVHISIFRCVIQICMCALLVHFEHMFHVYLYRENIWLDFMSLLKLVIYFQQRRTYRLTFGPSRHIKSFECDFSKNLICDTEHIFYGWYIYIMSSKQLEVD